MEKRLEFFVRPTHLRYEGLSRYMKVGWGNGYVKIPKDHPWYGLHYDEIPCEVHGGLTYSNWPVLGFSTKSKDDIDNKAFWVIGFDTAHMDDNGYNCSEEYVMHETINLAKQAEAVWTI